MRRQLSKSVSPSRAGRPAAFSETAPIGDRAARTAAQPARDVQPGDDAPVGVRSRHDGRVRVRVESDGRHDGVGAKRHLSPRAAEHDALDTAVALDAVRGEPEPPVHPDQGIRRGVGLESAHGVGGRILALRHVVERCAVHALRDTGEPDQLAHHDRVVSRGGRGAPPHDVDRAHAADEAIACLIIDVRATHALGVAGHQAHDIHRDVAATDDLLAERRRLPLTRVRVQQARDAADAVDARGSGKCHGNVAPPRLWRPDTRDIWCHLTPIPTASLPTTGPARAPNPARRDTSCHPSRYRHLSGTRGAIQRRRGRSRWSLACPLLSGERIKSGRIKGWCSPSATSHGTAKCR